jgi:hypothetical protein
MTFSFNKYIVLFVLLSYSSGLSQELINYIDTNNLDLPDAQSFRIGQLQQDASTKGLLLITLNDTIFTKSLVKFNLPDQSVLKINRSEAFLSDEKSVWTGRSSANLDATFIERGKNLTGNLYANNKLYAIRPVGDGLHAFFEVDVTKLPPDHDPDQDDIPLGIQEEDVEDELEDEQAIFLIDVMVVYTDAVSNSSPDVASLIDLAIKETNESFKFSGVKARLNLVHHQQLPYAETSNYKTDVTRLAANGDGHLDSVHSLRDTKKADIVVLLSNTGTSCGRAKAIDASASEGFVVCKQRCATGYYSFGHEIGHLLGARHNPERDSNNIPFPYGHGFLKASKKWRTIMSYDSQSGGCQRMKFWSSPRTKHLGDPTGTITKHDNAKALNNRVRKISRFRLAGNE